MKKAVTGSLLSVVAAGLVVLAAPTAGATTPAGHEQYRSADVHPMLWGFYSVFDTYKNCDDAGYYLERVGISRAHYCEYNSANPSYPWNLYIDYI